MNNEQFEKNLLGLSFLKGSTRKEKFEDYRNRVVYNIIINSSIMEEQLFSIEDWSFENGGEEVFAFYFNSMTKEFTKIMVNVDNKHNHEINGIRLNKLDGETIEVWDGQEWWVI